MSSEIIKNSRGHWQGILASFGIDRNLLTNNHSPCPCCKGKDRFRFDNKNGNGTYYCNQCGAGDGMNLLQAFTGRSFKELAKEIEKLLGIVGPDSKQAIKRPVSARKRLSVIGNQLVALSENDAVSRYLVNRGLNLSPNQKKNIRLHPALDYYQDGTLTGTYPAMVNLIVDTNGNAESYHITYLSSGKGKAKVNNAKKVMTPLNTIKGCAVRFKGKGEHINICEGIETALAVYQMTGIPTWSTITSEGMKSLQLPDIVKRVTIYGDNDSNYVGQASSYELARKLTHKNIDVQVLLPKNKDTDYLDELIKLDD